MKTDNYFFPAKDFEATKHFYADVLGLTVKFDFSSMGMIAYRIGDDEPALMIGLTRGPDAAVREIAAQPARTSLAPRDRRVTREDV